MRRPPDKKFGERLQELRKKKGLTQTAAAKIIGVGYKSLQSHEAGYIPNHSNLEKYLSFYKCNKNWLITGQFVPGRKIMRPVKDVVAEHYRNIEAPLQRVYIHQVDSNILRQIIEAVEEALEVRQLQANPSKKADFIAFLYDYFTETGKEVTKEKVERHLRLVA